MWEPDQALDVGLLFWRAGLKSAKGLDQEMELPQAREHAFLPARASVRQGGEFADQTRDSRRLRVDHAFRHVIPHPIRMRLVRDQSLPDDILESLVEFLQPGVDVVLSLGRAFFLGRRAFLEGGVINGRGGFRGGLFRALGALLEPVGEPRRGRVGGQGGRARGEEKTQPEAMFAGKFAAGARTLESGTIEINPDLIGIRATTFDLAPERGVGLSQGFP